ncbi:hypothetical protein MXB_1784 [Myxobolus squamalis]|nr:hypothetical protein MXB_1784 [Myxobolus squamalis]
MLINTNLPHQEAKFYPLLNTFFPRLYDIKYIIRDCSDLNGGLQHICQYLEVHLFYYLRFLLKEWPTMQYILVDII